MFAKSKRQNGLHRARAARKRGSWRSAIFETKHPWGGSWRGSRHTLACSGIRRAAIASQESTRRPTTPGARIARAMAQSPFPEKSFFARHAKSERLEARICGWTPECRREDKRHFREAGDNGQFIGLWNSDSAWQGGFARRCATKFYLLQLARARRYQQTKLRPMDPGIVMRRWNSEEDVLVRWHRRSAVAAARCLD